MKVASVLVAAAAATPVPLIIDTDIGGGGCMDVDGACLWLLAAVVLPTE
jgi:hypothetical protein